MSIIFTAAAASDTDVTRDVFMTGEKESAYRFGFNTWVAKKLIVSVTEGEGSDQPIETQDGVRKGTPVTVRVTERAAGFAKW